MPLPKFQDVIDIMSQVDKCARVLQRTDELAHELGTPAGGEVIDADAEFGPDDADDGDEEREDE